MISKVNEKKKLMHERKKDTDHKTRIMLMIIDLFRK